MERPNAARIPADNRPVFLFTNGRIHGITDGRFMEKYQFDWNKIQIVSGGILDSLPGGDIWE